MLIYLCLLVELCWFRVIYLGFLVVGHTHALIDQTFSAMKRRINHAKFIASPAAMMKLLAADSAPEIATGRSGKSVASKYRVPAAQHQVAVVHDYKTLLTPYFDKAVSMYNVPYNFKIENLGGVACVQAQMYVGAAWFPQRPSQFLKVHTHNSSTASSTPSNTPLLLLHIHPSPPTFPSPLPASPPSLHPNDNNYILPNNKATAPPISFDAVFANPVFAFPVPELVAIGGKEKLYAAYGFTPDSISLEKMRFMNAQKIKDLAALNRVIPAIAVNKHHFFVVYIFPLLPLLFQHI